MEKQWTIERNVPDAAVGYRAIIDAEGFTICNPSPMGEKNAQLIASAPELRALLSEAIKVIEDFLPNVGNCVIQDFGRLNYVLVESGNLLSKTGE